MRARLILGWLAVLLLAPAPLLAQVAGPPHVFVGGTVIDPDEVNLNFANIYAAACNRTGCVMTGGITWASDNTNDIGNSGTARPRDLWLARNAAIGGTLAVTGTSTFTGATTFTGAPSVNNVLTITTTTAPQLLVRYDTSNRLETSVSSAGAVTFNAVGGLPAFTFSDAVAVPAFSATGEATFSNAAGALNVASATPRLRFTESGATANEGGWWFAVDGDSFNFQTLNDALSVSATIWSVSRTGTVVDAFDIAAAQSRAVAGSAAAPAWSFTGDPDTGLYNTANLIGFATAGAARATLNASALTLQGSTNMVLSSGGMVFPGESVFAGLGTPGDGAVVFCSDCTFANPCAGAGTGAIAKRLNGTWRCD